MVVSRRNAHIMQSGKNSRMHALFENKGLISSDQTLLFTIVNAGFH